MNFAERSVSCLGAALGAEIKGIDLSKPITTKVLEFIENAWNDHLVLLFRNQQLLDEDLLKIAEALGGVQESAARKYLLEEGYNEGSGLISKHAGISIVSNVDEDGRPVSANGNNGSLAIGWHSDNSYVANPPKGSLLYAIKVPDNGGGSTKFVNQYVAYETLSESLKRRIIGLHMKHDMSRNAAGLPRPNVHIPKSRNEVKGPVHPLVRLHPETRQLALFLGWRAKWPSSYIVDFSDKESESLLDELWNHATQTSLLWSHHWRANDLLLWDNRCVMHCRTTIDSSEPRLLHRALIKGEPVIAADDGMIVQSV